MERIKKLADSVKKKIAAGEVVEGPFSVVKELIENSIDAGATTIDIQVLESGMKRIHVQDNGRGIHSNDIHLAVAEHATSKIEDLHDIELVASYGFRGEALSSISSVSRLTILSRSEDEDIGARLVCADGHQDKSDYAGPTGTAVIVENLFYNVPARKKFLKSPKTEMRYLREVFLKAAIPHPGISFSLDVDGKRSVSLPKAESMSGRIAQVFGKDVIRNLISESLKDISVTVSGFLSQPTYLRSSRSMQVLYINRRPVEYRYFGFLLSRAYEGMLSRGKYPAALIFLEIDPSLVDVNIHPAKREVKLFDQKYVDRLILSLAEKCLARKHDIAGTAIAPFKESMEKTDNESLGEPDRQAALPGISTFNSRTGTPSKVLSKASSIVRELEGLYQRIEGSADFSVIGIAFNTYILVEKDDTLHFIDFHAAHERLIYDSLMAGSKGYEKQSLLVPRVIELAVEEHQAIMDNIEEIAKIGFDIDDFSDNSIRISAVPEISEHVDISEIIQDFIASHEEDYDLSIPERMARSVACRSAVMSGDRLSADEIDRLVEMVFREGQALRCPHGRPFVYRIEKRELERMFKRQ